MNVKFQRFQKMYLPVGRSCPDEDKILDCAPLDSEEIEYPWRKQKNRVHGIRVHEWTDEKDRFNGERDGNNVFPSSETVRQNDN